MCVSMQWTARGCGTALKAQRCKQRCKVSVEMARRHSWVCGMAKAKKTKPRERLLRWRVSLIKGTPAKFIGYVQAADAKTAEDIAA